MTSPSCFLPTTSSVVATILATNLGQPNRRILSFFFVPPGFLFLICASLILVRTRLWGGNVGKRATRVRDWFHQIPFSRSDNRWPGTWQVQRSLRQHEPLRGSSLRASRHIGTGAEEGRRRVVPGCGWSRPGKHRGSQGWSVRGCDTIDTIFFDQAAAYHHHVAVTSNHRHSP